MNLRLSWTGLAWMLLLLLVVLMLLLLGALHDLRRELGRESRHARKRRLSLGNGLRIVRRHGGLGGCHVLVCRRWCCLHRVVTHHGLDLLKAHHLPRKRRSLLLQLW